MVTVSEFLAKNKNLLNKDGSLNLSKVAPIITPKNISSGGGNKATSPVSPTTTTKAPVIPPSPSYSPRGWQNVADTYKLISYKVANLFGASYDLSPKGSPGKNEALTSFLTSPGFVLGAPAVVSAVATPLIFGTGSAAAATSTATATTAKASILSKIGTSAALFGGGALAGGLLFGGKTTQDQTLSQTPQQDTTGNLDTRQSGGTQSGGDIGIRQEGQGNTLLFQSDRYFSSQTYNYAVPTQSISPQQTASASQSQEASGINWGLLALVGVGVFVLTRE